MSKMNSKGKTNEPIKPKAQPSLKGDKVSKVPSKVMNPQTTKSGRGK